MTTPGATEAVTPEQPFIEVTIRNAEGEVVHHSLARADTMSETEHLEAVSLIEGGMTARDAVFCARSIRSLLPKEEGK